MTLEGLVALAFFSYNPNNITPEYDSLNDSIHNTENYKNKEEKILTIEEIIEYEIIGGNVKFGKIPIPMTEINGKYGLEIEKALYIVNNNFKVIIELIKETVDIEIESLFNIKVKSKNRIDLKNNTLIEDPEGPDYKKESILEKPRPLAYILLDPNLKKDASTLESNGYIIRRYSYFDGDELKTGEIYITYEHKNEKEIIYIRSEKGEIFGDFSELELIYSKNNNQIDYLKSEPPEIITAIGKKGKVIFKLADLPNTINIKYNEPK
ncbi:hypothetical protein JW949_04145 [Candidatus Woesearchaeota archaeon]|nr:hypothetical protein [Candidatus Woesearchaeota archaeon]